MSEMKWLDVVVRALADLGGVASLQDIYKKVKELNLRTLNKTFENTIRRTIENNSKDSESYLEKNDDVFYSVFGKGQGVWGLRSFLQNETSASDYTFLEGKKLLVEHFRHERNTNLVKAAKQSFKNRHQRLFCEICGFDFSVLYGSYGDNFIEAHHIVPLSINSVQQESKIEDLAMLCSNCHKIIHRHINNNITLEHLRDIVRENQENDQK